MIPIQIHSHVYKLVILVLLQSHCSFAQRSHAVADSLQKAFHIPELGYAVVSSDQIIEQEVLGYKKINTDRKADLSDKFRIGSNTKAITGMIAARLVKQQKINWDTSFFELFPELKASSNKAYYALSLLDLLSFRTRLIKYTYTNEIPTREQFDGTDEKQRYQFAKWFLAQEPVHEKGKVHFSNLGYVAAGLMLEKASGKSYKELAVELGKALDIEIGFGNPNSTDTLQPWGHNAQLEPEEPGDNYKLNWLLAAGNIKMSLPDYAKFIQLQLLGLKGKSTLLSQKDFEFLHYGLPKFSVGWFWQKDADGDLFSYNIGNPGTFLTKVFVYKKYDLAFIVFSNAQTTESDQGLDFMFDYLKQSYILPLQK